MRTKNGEIFEPLEIFKRGREWPHHRVLSPPQTPSGLGFKTLPILPINTPSTERLLARHSGVTFCYCLKNFTFFSCYTKTSYKIPVYLKKIFFGFFRFSVGENFEPLESFKRGREWPHCTTGPYRPLRPHRGLGSLRASNCP